MSDDDLFDALKGIVNQARERPQYDRVLAMAVGKACRARGWLTQAKQAEET